MSHSTALTVQPVKQEFIPELWIIHGVNSQCTVNNDMTNMTRTTITT